MPNTVYDGVRSQMVGEQMAMGSRITGTPNQERRVSGKSSFGKSSAREETQALRETYSRIVDKNATSPLYLLRLDEDRKQFLLHMKETAGELAELLRELNPERSYLYSSLRAISSNSNSVTAELDQGEFMMNGQVQSGQVMGDRAQMMPEPVQIQVQRLATNQINVGNLVPSKSHILDAGTYRFQADVEGNLYQFQFQISVENTNRDILTKLADFLNQTAIGIEANVEEPEPNRVRMHLESESLGNVNLVNFSFEDTEHPLGGKGLVEYLGLNHTEQFPVNAAFILNGAEKELMKNSFTLNRCLHITLQAPSEETAEIRFAPDETNMLECLDGFVQRCNRLMEPEESGSVYLSRSMRHVIERHRNKLEQCGIHLTEDGLSVSEEQVTHALEDGTLKQLFFEDSPFVTDMKREMNQILLDPVQYTTRKVVAYPDTSRQIFLSPYAVSIYSGLFYNAYL